MRLLIITQKIDQNDAVLGFMHAWIAAFAEKAEHVVALGLGIGEVALPNNVRVFSLGKERQVSKLGRIINFYQTIWRERKKYDTVFVHMNPEYIVLGGLVWKLLGKKVSLWYAHKSTPWFLRVARFFTDVVFTSTKSGFRLPSKKVRVIGQGIDTEKFKVHSEKLSGKDRDGVFKIVTVGRITPSKDYDTLISAIELRTQNSSGPIAVSVIGPTSIASDEIYLKGLREKIVQKGLQAVIKFHGPVANTLLPEVLGEYDLFVNMGHTGSLDKVVPEAMSSGLPVLTCNEAFKEVLGPFTGLLMYPKGDFKALSERIGHIMALTPEKRLELGLSLRDIVVRDHSLNTFADKVISSLKRI